MQYVHRVTSQLILALFSINTCTVIFHSLLTVPPNFINLRFIM